MSRKIRVNCLTKEELTYELTIRGIGTGSWDQMRTSLSKAFQMEKEGTGWTRPSYPYTFADDVSYVTEKLEDITAGIESFDEAKISTQFTKWETKLNHIPGRVELMSVPEDDKEKQNTKSEFVAKIMQLMTNLEAKAKKYEEKNVTPAEISLLQIDDSLSGESDSEERHNSTTLGESSRMSARGTIRRVVKSTPVAKWNLQFSGDKKGMSLNAFLQRVEELRVARHITVEELLETAVDLFTGKALIWYRAVRKEVSNWNSLVKLLREEFQPIDYNEKLFEEIKRRTQGSDESIGIYLSIMTAIFSRLTCPVSEDIQLKVILKNISPFYQTQLGLTEITSISQLRTLGRKLECTREAVETFSLPSRRSNNTFEPDLAYVGTNGRDKSAQVASSTIRIRPVLDYILEQCEEDERPCLKFNVLGKSLMGLLDSGASVTILGNSGWKLLENLPLIFSQEKSKIRVANGEFCESFGTCDVLFKVRGRTKLVKTLVVPTLSHTLILGANFWKQMGIVPDLRHNEWYFSKEPEEIATMEYLVSQSVLLKDEESKLQEEKPAKFSNWRLENGKLFKYVEPVYEELKDVVSNWRERNVDLPFAWFDEMFIHRSVIADLPLAWSDEMFIHWSAITDLPFAWSGEMFIHWSAIADLPFAWSDEMFIHRSTIADLPLAWSDEMFIHWSAIADLPFAWSGEMFIHRSAIADLPFAWSDETHVAIKEKGARTSLFSNLIQSHQNLLDHQTGLSNLMQNFRGIHGD
ncbi:hypothetical protein NQ315_003978 [Exocentrus adspersus]|uniref:Peptidase A2 domain-containing protein n=1 Tax=Exocentrus adspersus TaxID=1586481 RepID=A0AAV8VBP3_9CUCU|nr:hypothetical protein NQ315_003978 [Exocentrus adspersus]